MNILNYLKDSLLMSKSEIMNFSSTAPHRYKIYQIPKRNSLEKRTIAHPSKELKFAQRLLISELEPILNIHKSSFAYKKGYGIKDNADMHKKSKYLLKMDFSNFFYSITPDMFFISLESSGITTSELDKELLSDLIFFKKTRRSALSLSIGAPTSPLISNFIMFNFDSTVYNYCLERGIVYTRYADDITFSTNKKNALFVLPKVIELFLSKEFNKKISLNKNKTKFSSKAHNRHVTGVTITNDGTLSIGRNRKRLISSMIHRFTINTLDDQMKLYLSGVLSHAIYIEPGFYARMEKKYGTDTLIKIKSFNYL